MNSRAVSLDAAYILHSRAYRDTSVILELFTRGQGRCSAVVRGARSEKSRFRGKLEPFTPMLVQLVGRSDLKTVAKTDFPGRPFRLQGDNLLIGMYINELLYRLLEKYYSLEALFLIYEALIQRLEQGVSTNAAVRDFELQLLAELGYGITFDFDARTGQPVEADNQYLFVSEEGFYSTTASSYDVFPGDELLHLAAGDVHAVDERRLRNLTRKCLADLLGDKPLKSRSLFTSVAR